MAENTSDPDMPFVKLVRSLRGGKSLRERVQEARYRRTKPAEQPAADILADDEQTAEQPLTEDSI